MHPEQVMDNTLAVGMHRCRNPACIRCQGSTEVLGVIVVLATYFKAPIAVLADQQWQLPMVCLEGLPGIDTMSVCKRQTKQLDAVSSIDSCHVA